MSFFKCCQHSIPVAWHKQLDGLYKETCVKAARSIVLCTTTDHNNENEIYSINSSLFDALVFIAGKRD